MFRIANSFQWEPLRSRSLTTLGKKQLLALGLWQKKGYNISIREDLMMIGMEGRIRFFLVVFLLLSRGAGAAEDDLYKFLWLDSDKKVYVLQNKVYQKKGSFYFHLGYVADISSNYEDLSGFQGALGYYFSENWGIELFYHLYSGSSNSDAKNLQELNGIVPFIRKVTAKGGGVLLWSPFYGKINIFNKIIYFDWSFGGGAGMVWGNDNAKTVAARRDEDIYEDTAYPAVMAKSSFRIYVTRRFSFGLEYHYDTYNARKVYTPEGRENGNRRVFREEFAFILGMSF